MRYLTICIFLTIFLFTFECVAQIEEIKVIASSGKVEFSNPAAKNWTNLLPGKKLSSKDRIKLGPNSYLSIINAQGNSIEWSKLGEISVADLSKKMNQQGKGISQKFASFVLSEISKVDNPTDNHEYIKQMSITGSVERSASSQDITIHMPRSTNVIDTVLTFSWYKLKDTQGYVFNLSDKFARPILTKELTDTIFSLNFNDLKITAEDQYYWSIAKKDDPNKVSDEFSFRLLNSQSKNAIGDTVAMIKQEAGDDNSAVGQLVLASYYEQNKIINRAMGSYQAAISLQPTVEDYKKAYAVFLIKTGLFDEAKRIWGN